MSENIYERLMNFLTAKRMASVGNIAAHLNVSVDEAISLLQDLAVNDKVRLAISNKNCSSGGCDSCSSCGSEASEQAEITERTIAISMTKR